MLWAAGLSLLKKVSLKLLDAIVEKKAIFPIACLNENGITEGKMKNVL